MTAQRIKQSCQKKKLNEPTADLGILPLVQAQIDEEQRNEEQKSRSKIRQDAYTQKPKNASESIRSVVGRQHHQDNPEQEAHDKIQSKEFAHHYIERISFNRFRVLFHIGFNFSATKLR